jgi:hypothetical protein
MPQQSVLIDLSDLSSGDLIAERLKPLREGPIEMKTYHSWMATKIDFIYKVRSSNFVEAPSGGHKEMSSIFADQ